MPQSEYNIACVPILRAAETSSFIGNKTTLFPVAFYLYFLTIDAAINYRISTSSLPALPAAETGSLSRGRGLGRGQQAKGLFAGIRKCSIFNCRINNHVLSPLHFLQQKSAAETAYLLNIKNALLIYKTRFNP